VIHPVNELVANLVLDPEQARLLSEAMDRSCGNPATGVKAETPFAFLSDGSEMFQALRQACRESLVKVERDR